MSRKYQTTCQGASNRGGYHRTLGSSSTRESREKKEKIGLFFFFHRRPFFLRVDFSFLLRSLARCCASFFFFLLSATKKKKKLTRNDRGSSGLARTASLTAASTCLFDNQRVVWDFEGAKRERATGEENSERKKKKKKQEDSAPFFRFPSRFSRPGQGRKKSRHEMHLSFC